MFQTFKSKHFRTQNIEEEEEQHEEIASEPVIEEAHDIQMESSEGDGEYYDQQQYESVQQTNDDNGSSNYDDNLTYEQQSNEIEETNQTDETAEIETFIADLADIENANSFPSGCDDNSIERSHQVGQEENSSVQLESDSNQMQGFMDDNDYQMADGPENDQSNEKTEDTFAQSEQSKPGDPDATDLDAENISEDELPGPAKPKVQDAEEVSDEELPGPKL